LEFLFPVAFAILTWWLSTLLLMRCILRAKRQSRVVLASMSVIAIVCLLMLLETRDWTTPLGVYLAFLSALGLWAWLEASYFLGFVTGPRPEACPPGASNKQRFIFGIQASLYHELAVLLTVAIIFWLTYGAPNLVALWVFSLLWIMRWSAKLNIFLGVRNLHLEFWPSHLQYLASYAKTANMNPLYPLTASLSLLMFFWVTTKAVSSDNPFEFTAFVLVAVLLFLAILEHVFLMYRVPDQKLWGWALGGTKGKAVSATASRLRHSQGP